jgi:hypothetical protein
VAEDASIPTTTAQSILGMITFGHGVLRRLGPLEDDVSIAEDGCQRMTEPFLLPLKPLTTCRSVEGGCNTLFLEESTRQNRNCDRFLL